MKTSVTRVREILFQLGALPRESLLLFKNRQALQRFIDLATKIVAVPSGDADPADTTPRLVGAPALPM